MAGFFKRTGKLLVLLVSMVGPLALAQSGGTAADQADPQVLLQQLEQVQQQLLQIQDAALTEHPELRKQAENLQGVLLEAMRSNGFDPEASLARVNQLERQLQAQGGDVAQRQDLANDLRDEQRRLVVAEREALESEQVQLVSEEFTQNLLQAMREQDSQTDALVLLLQEKHAQLQEVVTARGG